MLDNQKASGVKNPIDNKGNCSAIRDMSNDWGTLCKRTEETIPIPTLITEMVDTKISLTTFGFLDKVFNFDLTSLSS